MREQLQRRDAFDRAAVDVAVTVPRNSWVRGRGAALDVTGVLRLEKNPGDSLRISGQVDTVRGTYRFQGKRFDIRRGAVSFEGSATPDPLLDIEATHRVRDITIVIVLSGRASDPIVTLSSEPTMSEDDVLSYLFFGRSTSQLGSKQPTGNLDRAATALAAGIALQEASRLVEDALPVDTIDVRIEEDGSSGDVGVGKYLTNDLFVRYERGFGTTATDGVRIEMRLNDQWSVETEASSDESAGADLVWSFDY
jgi:translocation and assembly module TamB